MMMFFKDLKKRLFFTFRGRTLVVLLTISFLPFFFISFLMINRTQETISKTGDEVQANIMEYVIHSYNDNIQNQAQALDMQLATAKKQLLQLRSFTEQTLRNEQALSHLHPLSLIEGSGGFLWEPVFEDRSNVGISSYHGADEQVLNQLRLTQLIEPPMMQIVNGNEAIAAVYFISAESAWRIYPPMNVEIEHQQQFLKENIDLTQEPFYTAPLNNYDGVVGWTTPYIDATHRDEMFSLVTAINNQKGEKIGIIAIDITTDEALYHLLTMQFKEESSYAFLVDDSYNMIAKHPKMKENQKFLSKETLHAITQSKEPYVKLINDEERIFLSAPIHENGWSLIFSIQINEIIESINAVTSEQISENEKSLIQQLIFISLATLLFALFCTLAIWRSVTRPVNDILLGIQQMENGAVAEIPPQQLKEFNDVQNAFNRMSEQINKLLSRYRSLNNQLELKVERRTKQLKNMNDELTKMNDALVQVSEKRTQLLANLAHDLKTPLTLMRGYMEAIQDGVIEQDDYDTYFERMQHHLQSINQLMSNMSELTEIETSKQLFQFQNISATTVFEKILHPFLHDEDLTITIEPNLPSIRVDVRYIERLLMNLLDNALKYAKSEHPIPVNVYLEEKGVTLRIQDFGEGISEQSLPYIFDRFYRVDQSRNSSKSGNGLGLAIVKEVVDAHDASIEVMSEVGRGTIFIIQFPIVHDEIESS